MHILVLQILTWRQDHRDSDGFMSGVSRICCMAAESKGPKVSWPTKSIWLGGIPAEWGIIAKKKYLYLMMTTEKQKGSKVYQFTITDQHNWQRTSLQGETGETREGTGARMRKRAAERQALPFLVVDGAEWTSRNPSGCKGWDINQTVGADIWKTGRRCYSWAWASAAAEVHLHHPESVCAHPSDCDVAPGFSIFNNYLRCVLLRGAEHLPLKWSWLLEDLIIHRSASCFHCIFQWESEEHLLGIMDDDFDRRMELRRQRREQMRLEAQKWVTPPRS